MEDARVDISAGIQALSALYLLHRLPLLFVDSVESLWVRLLVSTGFQRAYRQCSRKLRFVAPSRQRSPASCRMGRASPVDHNSGCPPLAHPLPLRRQATNPQSRSIPRCPSQAGPRASRRSPQASCRWHRSERQAQSERATLADSFEAVANELLAILLCELPHVPAARHVQVLDVVETRKLMGRGLGWIDLHLLASAMLAKVPFWTVDNRLATLAQELGLGRGN